MKKKGVLRVYLQGGHVVILDHVKDVTVTHHPVSGKFVSYNIEFVKDHEAPFIIFSIQDIVAMMFE